MLALLLAAVLSQEPASCRHDSDCIISTTVCCAGCCGPSPYATSKTADAEKKQACAATTCEPRTPCTIVCEPPLAPDALEAKCVAHQCTSRMKKPRATNLTR